VGGYLGGPPKASSGFAPAGNDNEEIQRLKKYLTSEFDIKDLGNLKYVMGN